MTNASKLLPEVRQAQREDIAAKAYPGFHWHARASEQAPMTYSLRGLRRAHARTYPNMYLSLVASKAAAAVQKRREERSAKKGLIRRAISALGRGIMRAAKVGRCGGSR